VSRKPKFQVPHYPDGSIPDYVSLGATHSGYSTDDPRLALTWRDPEPFEAVLKFTCFSRGRSAAHALMYSETGARYTVFLTDLSEMIKDQRWCGGIAGRFIPCKRGQNYGVRLAKEGE
jgi:hypothetical protein